MKKLFLVFAALFIGFTASAKSYTNNIGGGIRLPMYSEITFDMTGDPTFELWPMGLDFQYLGYFDNGFALKGNIDIGGSSIKLKDSNVDFDFSVFAVERVAAGYGFIRTDKIFFGLFGFVGFDATIFGNSSSVEVCSRFVLGVDPAAVFTLGEKFSLYASLGAGVGFGSYYMEQDSGSNTKKSNGDLKTSFVMYPVFGMCCKF